MRQNETKVRSVSGMNLACQLASRNSRAMRTLNGTPIAGRGEVRNPGGGVRMEGTEGAIVCRESR